MGEPRFYNIFEGAPPLLEVAATTAAVRSRTRRIWQSTKAALSVSHTWSVTSRGAQEPARTRKSGRVQNRAQFGGTLWGGYGREFCQFLTPLAGVEHSNRESSVCWNPLFSNKVRGFRWVPFPFPFADILYIPQRWVPEPTAVEPTNNVRGARGGIYKMVTF